MFFLKKLSRLLFGCGGLQLSFGEIALFRRLVLGIELEIVEVCVIAAFGEQLIVGAGFGCAAFVHDDDLIGLEYGGKPVGDGDDCPTDTERFDGRVDFLFGFGVER